MQEGLSSIPKVYAVEETELGYSFTTDSGLTYNLTLKQTDVLDDTEFKNYPVFELGLFPSGHGFEARTKRDDRVGKTVCEVLERLFEHSSMIVVFSCYPDDGKSGARLRRFKTWYAKYLSKSQVNMLCSDVSYEDHENVGIAICFAKTHPFGEENITEVFTMFRDELEQNKD
jgi:hypothetical protein